MNVLHLFIKFQYFFDWLFIPHHKYTVVYEGELIWRKILAVSIQELSPKIIYYFLLSLVHSSFAFLDWIWIIFKPCQTNYNIFDEVVREHINEKLNWSLKLLIKSWILAVYYYHKRVHVADCFKSRNNIMNIIWINIPWVTNTRCING